jgi:hypothetical protein
MLLGDLRSHHVARSETGHSARPVTDRVATGSPNQDSRLWGRDLPHAGSKYIDGPEPVPLPRREAVTHV